jgi:AcrR family transcriptional regulator
MTSSTSGGRVRRLDPEVRREQILDAADRAFATGDPSRVTFEQIAAEAGVSRALVYNYFGDRNGLVAAVYLRAFDRLDDELAAAVDLEAEPSARARQVVTAYLRFAECNAGIWNLVGRSSVGRHPAVHHARQTRFERTAAAWGDTHAARAVVCGVVGSLEAVTLDWLDHQDLPLEDVADLLHRLVWGGLSALEGDTVHLPDASVLALPT